ncbi:MAG: hypothetical protein ABI763_05710 [Bacteroidota bacterium]
MKPFRQITSTFLLLVFLFSAAPKELLHEYFHQHETVDFICTDSCADHLTVLHEHCELLQLSHPPLYCSVQTFSFTADELIFVQTFAGTHEYQFFSSPYLFFRGPPSLS